MDFDYVVMPAIILAIAILVIVVAVRRMRSLSTQSYPKFRKVVDRIVLAIVIVLVAFLAGNCAYNAIAIQVFRASNPPMGSLYSVNGHNMQLYCVGKGSPAIVLEPGLSASSDALVMQEFQSKLAGITRVCAYDRAGLGWSESQPGPSDADHIAANLHAVLAQSGEKGPYVFLVHSYGGIYARDYTARYPDEVAGLILLDSATPFQEQRSELLRFSGPKLAILRVAYMLGLPRLMGGCGRPFPGVEGRLGKAMGEDACLVHPEMFKEFQAMTQSSQETEHAGPFGSLPILIISEDTSKLTSGPNPPKQMVELAHLVDEMQEDLKRLSTRSRRIIATGSGHIIQRDREDLVVKETQVFVDQLRGVAPQPTSYGSTIAE